MRRSSPGRPSVTSATCHSTRAARACATEGDKTELACPAGSFLSRRADAQACRDAFELLSLDQGKARLLEAARRLWLASDRSKDDASRSLSLLDAAIEHGSQRARFARLLGARRDSATTKQRSTRTRSLHALDAGKLSPPALGDLWTSFRFSDQAGSALVRALAGGRAARAAVRARAAAPHPRHAGSRRRRSPRTSSAWRASRSKLAWLLPHGQTNAISTLASVLRRAWPQHNGQRARRRRERHCRPS